MKNSQACESLDNRDFGGIYSRQEVEEVLNAIENKLLKSEDSYMHALALLNHLLRQPNARDIYDDDIIARMKEIWLKLKGMGITLSDPPMLS